MEYINQRRILVRMTIEGMALNLLKLCVGVSGVDQLQKFIDQKLEQAKSSDTKGIQAHTTRVIPKHINDLTTGGSLYWVIKGNIQARQVLADIRPFTDKQGIKRCDLILQPELILTEWQPHRAFQGWRYLKQKDAPKDVSSTKDGISALPPHLRLELSILGLL